MSLRETYRLGVFTMLRVGACKDAKTQSGDGEAVPCGSGIRVRIV